MKKSDEQKEMDFQTALYSISLEMEEVMENIEEYPQNQIDCLVKEALTLARKRYGRRSNENLMLDLTRK